MRLQKGSPVKNLSERIRTLERIMLQPNTPESKALDLLVAAERGDAAARLALEGIVADNDQILGGVCAALLAGPLGPPTAAEIASVPLATEVLQ